MLAVCVFVLTNRMLTWNALLGGFFGTVCVLGGIYVVQYLAEPKHQKRKKDMPPGLVNVGATTCYSNTVLQCLAPCLALHQWLMAVAERTRNRGLQRETLDILQALSNNCDPDVLLLSCESLLAYLQSATNFQYLTQQDCHEFFQILSEKLQLCPNTINKSHGLISAANTSFMPTIPKFPFVGRLSTRLACADCGFVSPLSLESFVSLSLSVPSAKSLYGLKSLKTMLTSYTSEELLGDAVCENCHASKCLKKRTQIFSSPAIICFHISRSGWINESATKQMDQVTFPEIFDLSSFLHYKPGHEVLYRIRSLIVHFGSTSSSGHFVAYRRSPSGRRWCYASDEEITFTDKDTVFSSEPYMLFYEKFTPSQPAVGKVDDDIMRRML